MRADTSRRASDAWGEGREGPSKSGKNSKWWFWRGWVGLSLPRISHFWKSFINVLCTDTVLRSTVPFIVSASCERGGIRLLPTDPGCCLNGISKFYRSLCAKPSASPLDASSMRCGRERLCAATGDEVIRLSFAFCWCSSWARNGEHPIPT